MLQPLTWPPFCKVPLLHKALHWAVPLEDLCKKRLALCALLQEHPEGRQPLPAFALFQALQQPLLSYNKKLPLQSW